MRRFLMIALAGALALAVVSEVAVAGHYGGGSGGGSTGSVTFSTNTETASSPNSLTLKGNVADSASQIGVIIDNVTQQTNQTGVLLDVRSGGLSFFQVDPLGGIVLNNQGSVIAPSSSGNGTNANAGGIQATSVNGGGTTYTGAAATGGVGAGTNWIAGAGGTATGVNANNNIGGAGGDITWRTGAGGAASGSSASNLGGNGGAWSLRTGNGGAAATTGGNGGTISILAGNGGATNGAAGNITIVPGTANGTGLAGSVTIGRTTAAAGAGVRNAATRNIVRNSTSVTDCAAGNLTPTVAAILDGTIYTCATAQTLTLPTAQGASGLVQGLPGTPAVGDVFQIKMAENHATNTFTLIAGTGGTIYGIATITNGARTWDCRITAITGGSETYTCY